MIDWSPQLELDATWRPQATLETLRQRAALVTTTRAFFAQRGVLEVDTPVLQQGVNLDHGVSPFIISTTQEPRFLPTSPEHALKRLVAAGYGAVWTLAPAFRSGESGRRHRPEFRMLEWYRPDWDDARLRDEVTQYMIALTGDTCPSEIITWRNAYRTHADIDPDTASDADLHARLGSMADAVTNRNEALDLILVSFIEPHLGRDGWTYLIDYPATAAAQARTRRDTDGRLVAARFELYRHGIELANGYHECIDASELQARLEAERQLRANAKDLRLDQYFAEAMRSGLGDCAGVAVGFDRVVALALGLTDVGDGMAFPFERA